MSNYEIKLSMEDKINIPLNTIFTARVCSKGILHLLKDREVVSGSNIILDCKEHKKATKPKRSRKSRQDKLEERLEVVEKNQKANIIKGLINSGVITLNEGRKMMNLPKIKEAYADELATDRVGY